MRKAIWKQIGENEGKPIKGMVYVDMTAEEIAEYERMAAETPDAESTSEERIAELEAALELLLSGVSGVTE